MWNIQCNQPMKSYGGVKIRLKTKLWVLLSPPGVFGGVETGQVFVVFEDIHLFKGPEKQETSYYDYNQKLSTFTFPTQKTVLHLSIT